jgi:hypothetical protein
MECLNTKVALYLSFLNGRVKGGVQVVVVRVPWTTTIRNRFPDSWLPMPTIIVEILKKRFWSKWSLEGST